jgi:hypothetical protein
MPKEQLNLLIYCSFFDPNFISLDLVNKLLDAKVESLESLSNDGLIDFEIEKRGIKLHKLVQNEVLNYYEKNSADFEKKEEILNMMSIVFV